MTIKTSDLSDSAFWANSLEIKRRESLRGLERFHLGRERATAEEEYFAARPHLKPAAVKSQEEIKAEIEAETQARYRFPRLTGGARYSTEGSDANEMRRLRAEMLKRIP